MLHEYNVDSYLGLQLLCCMDYDGEKASIDPDKYSYFLTLLNEDVIRLAAGKIERLRYELEHYEWKDLLEEYCLLLPSAYRMAAFGNCRRILELKKPMTETARLISERLEKELNDE